MDTTLRYIKMCEKSPLQKLWEPKSGDWVVRKYLDAIVEKNKQEVQILIREIASGKNTYWVIVNEHGESRLTQGELHKKLFTCLFRQDQLQEMLRETHSMGPCNLIMFLHQNLFADFECPDDADDKGPCEGCRQEGLYWRKTFNTLEQLWHAFVVSEKYGKIWDNKKEEWIKKLQ